MTELTFPRQHAATRRFTLGVPRNLSLSPDGARLLFLRSAAGDDPQLSLLELDLATGDERVVADADSLAGDQPELTPAERARRERQRESAEGIVAYTTSRDQSVLVFTLGSELHAVVEGRHRVLPTVGSIFDPVVSPDGRRVAYVSEVAPEPTDAGAERWVKGLWVVATDGASEATLLRGDDDPLVSWGRAEFVAAEEMGRARGFWWSPDGEWLLAARVSEHPVERWHIADPANPQTTPNEIRYPAAGTANASVTLDLMPVGRPYQTTGADRELPDWSAPSDGAPDGFEYLANVVWAPGHDPLIVRQTRDQRTVEAVEWVGVTDPATGTRPARRTLLTDPVWVELLPGSPSWAGDELLTIRDCTGEGVRALFADERRLSGDDLQVRSIVGAEPAAGDRPGTVMVTASPSDDPTSVHVGRVRLDGSSVEAGWDPLTTEPGVHGARLGGSAVVITSQVPERPGTETVVHHAAGVTTVPDRATAPALRAVPHFFAAGQRRLASALMLPGGVDPADYDGPRLPVLLDPYGGPHAQRVLRVHNAHTVSQWFADQGFAVLVTDGRGTPGRGPDFEREVWGDLAEPVLVDQIDALDHALDAWPFLDGGRVGIRGWSFGGYLSALAVLRRPDRFHAAVAGAPVTTWDLYDTHYTERYLGHPADHAEAYERTDLLVEARAAAAADRPVRPLLIVHGLADDNVVAAHTLRLSSALLETGRAHSVLPLSGVTHMTPQEVVAENLLGLQRDFLSASLV